MCERCEAVAEQMRGMLVGVVSAIAPGEKGVILIYADGRMVEISSQSPITVEDLEVTEC